MTIKHLKHVLLGFNHNCAETQLFHQYYSFTLQASGRVKNQSCLAK